MVGKQGEISKTEMFHSGEGSHEFSVEGGVPCLGRRKASWSKKPEEPKNLELAAEKQLPRESLKHQQPEKL